MRLIGLEASTKHVHENRNRKGIQEGPCAPGPSKVLKNLLKSPCPSEEQSKPEDKASTNTLQSGEPTWCQ